METKTPTSSYHHQRAPRTPESYFNVPESIALLNIVKSERIQSAFQSNRKNHASVWEMVAEVLNRFSARKRSAKQCCNRYENLKKIYTQLKKNPERHVRRNWPYMFLFKEIEEQRGECWGSTTKRLNLLTKTHHHNNELSYYQRRRQAVELNSLLNGNKDVASIVHSNDSNSNICKMERFLPNHFVETQLTEGNGDLAFDEQQNGTATSLSTLTTQPMSTVSTAAAAVVANVAALQLQQQVTSAAVMNGGNNVGHGLNMSGMGNGGGLTIRKELQNGFNGNGNGLGGVVGTAGIFEAAAAAAAAAMVNSMDSRVTKETFSKDCNGALNLQTNENNISMKSEPLSEGEFNPDDIQLMQTNYNGSQSYFPHDISPDILHPDVIVDTDNISSVSSTESMKSKRKLSSSIDGDSTNFELIEYLKRREKRDELMLKRMDEREERLLNLLERTVVAIETLACVDPNKKKSNQSKIIEKENEICTHISNDEKEKQSELSELSETQLKDNETTATVAVETNLMDQI